MSLPERLRPSLHNSLLAGPAAKIWEREFSGWLAGHRFHAILWGPPGVGKTTISRMLAEASGLFVTHLSAVRDGVKEIRAAAEEHPGQIIFIDEIHRLNKAQQDVLLPIMEQAEAWILGATTESPQVSLNPAILSRVRTIYVRALREQDLRNVLQQGIDLLDPTPEKRARLHELVNEKILALAEGDARRALHLLESLAQCQTQEEEQEILNNFPHAFTAKKHYDWASAMIKSLRGSDPDAALFYAIAALDSGENPLFILRRAIIFASEDVGNADPQALGVAVNAYKAVEAVGMPEGRIPLAQAITYLASTVKSNKAYEAIDQVRAWREKVTEEKGEPALAPPKHLTKAGASMYQYPHAYPGAFVKAEYLPQDVAAVRKETGPAYRPSQYGVEERLKERLHKLWRED